jgi:outer membrane protein
VIPEKRFPWMVCPIIMITLILSQPVSAQTKFRYIDSQKILTSLPEYADIQKELDTENAAWVQELQKMDQDIRNLKEQIDQQSLMLSEAKRIEKNQELQALYQKAQNYQTQKWGERGEAFQRQQELLKPLIDKIQKVIDRIAEEEDYDFIFDTVAGNVLFAKSRFDITEDVLKELEKETPAKTDEKKGT